MASNLGGPGGGTPGNPPGNVQQATSAQSFRTLEHTLNTNPMYKQEPYAKLIRPAAVFTMPFLDGQRKRELGEGVMRLWNGILARATNDPGHAQAVNKLTEMTQSMSDRMKQFNAAQARTQQQQQPQQQQQQQQQVAGQKPAASAATAGTQPQATGQQQRPPQAQGQAQGQAATAGAAAAARAQPQPGQTTSQTQVQQPGQTLAQQTQQTQQQAQQRQQGQHPQMKDIPEKYRSQAERVQWVTAPGQQPSHLIEIKRRYAHSLWIIETAQAEVARYDTEINTARQQGREPSQDLLHKRHLAGQQLGNARSFQQQLQQQQTALRKQQVQQAGQTQTQAQAQAQTQAQAQAQAMNAAQAQNQQNKPPQNPAVEAARQQAALANAMVNRPGSAQASVPGVNVNGLPNQSGAGQLPAGYQASPQSAHAPQLPQQQLQLQAQAQAQTQAQGQGQQAPQPLSHKNALAAAAQTYQNANNQGQQGNQAAKPQQQSQQQNQGATGQQTGQITTSASALQRPDGASADTVAKANSARWPMTKSFTPQPVTAVQMGPARPTLSGVAGSGGPMGMLGQPAQQAMPAYNLHGPGDRVLDKKKLDELVRQVMGVGGADADEAGSLLPEVEESILSLADEFVDNVVTSACKAAKMRGSQTLEVRDIQLILERQYNIRIPGYATDDVRTVRKIQPTAGYLQKMTAVQNAKIVGNRNDV